MLIPENLKDLAVDLWHWQHGGTNFNSRLFDLITRSDFHNRERIRKGFPDEVVVYELWHSASTEQDFYLAAGILRVDSKDLRIVK